GTLVVARPPILHPHQQSPDPAAPPPNKFNKGPVLIPPRHPHHPITLAQPHDFGNLPLPANQHPPQPHPYAYLPQSPPPHPPPPPTISSTRSTSAASISSRPSVNASASRSPFHMRCTGPRIWQSCSSRLSSTPSISLL